MEKIADNPEMLNEIKKILSDHQIEEELWVWDDLMN